MHVNIIRMRKIIFYKTEQGIAPVEEFLDELSPKQTQKMLWVMRLVEQMPRVPSTYLKKLTDSEEIWEIRAQLGSDIFRVLGFFMDGATFIAVSGFRKKTLPVPLTERSLAEKRRKEHLGKHKRGKK